MHDDAGHLHQAARCSGELMRVMSILAACSINVVYSYSMISTYIVLCTSDIDEAVRRLSNSPSR